MWLYWAFFAFSGKSLGLKCGLYLSVSVFAVLSTGDLLTFLASFSACILLTVSCLWFSAAFFC